MKDLANCLVVGMGGFVGAIVRFVLGRWAAQKWGADFPYGTLLINVSGSFVLGLFASLSTRLAWNDSMRLLIAIGFLGAFTTFSTFAFETFELVRQASLIRAAANVIGSFALGLLAVYLGVVVSRLLLRQPA